MTATILDEVGLNGVYAPRITVPFCANCILPIGVTINPDTALGVFTISVGTTNPDRFSWRSSDGRMPRRVRCRLPAPPRLIICRSVWRSIPAWPSDTTQSVTVVATAAGVNQTNGRRHERAGFSFLRRDVAAAGQQSGLADRCHFRPGNPVFLATDSGEQQRL